MTGVRWNVVIIFQTIQLLQYLLILFDIIMKYDLLV